MPSPIKPAEGQKPDRRQAEPAVVAEQQVEGIHRPSIRALKSIPFACGVPTSPSGSPRSCTTARRTWRRPARSVPERGVIAREERDDRHQRAGQEEQQRRSAAGPPAAARPKAATNAAAGSSNVAANAAKNPQTDVAPRRSCRGSRPSPAAADRSRTARRTRPGMWLFSVPEKVDAGTSRSRRP